MIRIKYKNPENINTYITETIDEEQVNLAEHCEHVHKNLLCKDICTGENCKIWIEINDEFILAGVTD